jgi:hypothetical protein
MLYCVPSRDFSVAGGQQASNHRTVYRNRMWVTLLQEAFDSAHCMDA